MNQITVRGTGHQAKDIRLSISSMLTAVHSTNFIGVFDALKKHFNTDDIQHVRGSMRMENYSVYMIDGRQFTVFGD